MNLRQQFPIKFLYRLFQVSSVYLLITVHLEMVSSFGASLFGNRFLFRNHRYVTKPSQAYQLREPYAQKYGPYGDNFIQTVTLKIFFK